MKKVLFVLSLLLSVSLCFSQSIGQMTTGWTSTIATSKLPIGATVPTVTDPTSGYQSVSWVIDLTPASTFDNATETTAWTAIGAATLDSLEANYIVDVWAIDTSLTADGRAVITNVVRMWDNFDFKDWREQYTAATDIYRVWGRFEWKLDPP